ncbi:MAG: hypothetical protein ACREAC_01935, partial [Blastocatellia bacterium]
APVPVARALERRAMHMRRFVFTPASVVLLAACSIVLGQSPDQASAGQKPGGMISGVVLVDGKAPFSTLRIDLNSVRK